MGQIRHKSCSLERKPPNSRAPTRDGGHAGTCDRCIRLCCRCPSSEPASQLDAWFPRLLSKQAVSQPCFVPAAQVPPCPFPHTQTTVCSGFFDWCGCTDTQGSTRRDTGWRKGLAAGNGVAAFAAVAAYAHLKHQQQVDGASPGSS